MSKMTLVLILDSILFTLVLPYHLECQTLTHLPFACKWAGNQKESLKPQKNRNCPEEY